MGTGGMYMEKIDPQMERRVWQRVGQGPGTQREDLRPLLALAWEAAGDYRFLLTRLTGPAGEQAKMLYEAAQDSCACLRGLQLLRGASPAKQPPLPQVQQTARHVLERSYRRARSLAGAYMARAGDGECGMVFVALAKREEENCVRLAGMMGR